MTFEAITSFCFYTRLPFFILFEKNRKLSIRNYENLVQVNSTKLDKLQVLNRKTLLRKNQFSQNLIPGAATGGVL